MPLTLNLMSVSCKTKKKKVLESSTFSLITAGSDLEAVRSDGSHWEGEIVNTGCTLLRETRGDFWVTALYLIKRPNYYIILSSGTHTHV